MTARTRSVGASRAPEPAFLTKVRFHTPSGEAIATIKKALPEHPSLVLTIQVYGTTWTGKGESDGGRPFTSGELAALVRRGVERSKAAVTVEVCSEVKPEFYGDDAPGILRGKLRASGEHFTVVVGGIN